MPIRNTETSRVRNIPLFRGANDSAFAMALSGAFLQRFPAGTTLLMEGDSVDFLYILLEGAVELGASWKSKDTTLAIISALPLFSWACHRPGLAARAWVKQSAASLAHWFCKYMKPC